MKYRIHFSDCSLNKFPASAPTACCCDLRAKDISRLGPVRAAILRLVELGQRWRIYVAEGM